MMQERPVLRTAVVVDAARIHEVHTLSVRGICAPFYSPEVIDGWLSGRSPQGYAPAIERGELFVADAAGEIVGFGHAIPGEVLAAFVIPTAARRGVGRLIMERAMEMARSDHDEPVELESTLNAVGFYEAFGFRQVGRSVLQRGPVEVPVVLMRHHS